MEILEYFSCNDREIYFKQIKSYEWRAANYLAELLEQDRFHALLGKTAKLFLLAQGEELISFLTLSAYDCIAAPEAPGTPWLGFFHTAPRFRGNRYGKILIDYACGLVRKRGEKQVYVATDHIGLYEKYGFSYLCSQLDIYGEESRVYIKTL